jgi:type IV secretion system protein VirB1
VHNSAGTFARRAGARPDQFAWLRVAVAGTALTLAALCSPPSLAQSPLAASAFGPAMADDRSGRTSAGFAALAQTCAPHVDTQTLAAVVRVESGFNPYAIGVVGARLQRQPRNYEEAVATAQALAERGYNFSVGLGQVNVHNLPRYGETIETAFDPCRNLRVSGEILQRCFARSADGTRDQQGALRDAFSCYYSGNFATGYRQGYVARVIASAFQNLHDAMHERDHDVLRPMPIPFATGTSSAKSAATGVAKEVSALTAHTTREAVGTDSKQRASPLRPSASLTSHRSTLKRCVNPDAKQFITIPCADSPGRWCTRCLDTVARR